MPYISKYYTCEEVDQRLLQGYYDDFVKAGFVGTIEAFHELVLSIKDKADRLELTQLKDDILREVDDADIILQDNIDDLEDMLRKINDDLKGGIPTKVSELENDKNYQTLEEVQKYLSDLVDGADKSLDTLRELANALNNDPNFATNITNLLTQLQTTIEQEVTRAKESEARLNTDLANEVDKREKGDSDIRALIDQFNTRLLALQTNLTEFYNNLNSQITSLSNEIHTVDDRITSEVTRLEQLINTQSEEDRKLCQDKMDSLEASISQEATERKEDIKEVKESIVDLTKEVNNRAKETDQLHSTLDADIRIEAATRQSEDAKLQSALNEEATNRTSDKAELLSKLSEETTNRITEDNTLKEKLDVETKARKADILEVKTQIQLETTTRENEDNLIRSEIANLRDNLTNTIQEVASDLSRETSRAQEAENNKVDKKEGYGLSKNDFTDGLLNKLMGVQANANYISRVSELINDEGFQTKEEVEAAIQKVVDLAPETLNTLRELAEALDNDPNFAASITQKISQLGTQLNEEVQNRKDANEQIKEAYTTAINGVLQTLQASITVLEGTVNNNYRELDGAISGLENLIDVYDEELSKTKADLIQRLGELRTQVTEQIAGFNTRWQEYKESVDLNILSQDNKIAANTSAIQSNLELIQNLQKQYAEINSDFESLVKSEASIRRSEDEALKANIDLLDQRITQEASYRDISDKELETKIDNNKAELDNSISSLQSEVEGLGNQLQGVTSREQELQNQLTQLQSDFDEYKQQTKDLLEDIYRIIKL